MLQCQVTTVLKINRQRDLSVLSLLNKIISGQSSNISMLNRFQDLMSSSRQLTAPSDTDLLRFPAFIFQALTTVSAL